MVSWKEELIQSALWKIHESKCHMNRSDGAPSLMQHRSDATQRQEETRPDPKKWWNHPLSPIHHNLRLTSRCNCHIVFLFPVLNSDMRGAKLRLKVMAKDTVISSAWLLPLMLWVWRKWCLLLPSGVSKSKFHTKKKRTYWGCSCLSGELSHVCLRFSLNKHFLRHAVVK